MIYLLKIENVDMTCWVSWRKSLLSIQIIMIMRGIAVAMLLHRCESDTVQTKNK